MIYVLFYLICSLLGLTLIKLGGNYPGSIINVFKLDIKISLVSILGFISYAISFIIFATIIIPHFELSYISALLTGITQILILIIAFFIFKENINIFKIMGVVTIIIGIILINIKK